MSSILAIARRELAGYFGTPIAYVFLVVFVALSGIMTFYTGNLLGRGSADLLPFFTYLPWLFLVFVPAVGMRLWAEERKSGSIELLLTLPIAVYQAVIGKWLAGWAFIGVALLATMPLWATVNILGDPDNAVIAVGYGGAFVLSGVLLAIAACASALTRNQVIAYVIGVALIFLFVTAGTPLVLDAVTAVFPAAVGDAVASLSVLIHYDGPMRGLVAASDLVYALSMIAFWLFATAVTIELEKAG
jgi:ABC-2 type transport system permease protein